MLSHSLYTKAKLVTGNQLQLGLGFRVYGLQLATHNHIADYLIVPFASS